MTGRLARGKRGWIMAKSGTSEKQKLANRENAKKSTGPRTEQGKQTTRRNAVKHGLAGRGEVVPDEIAEEMEARVGVWTKAMRPADEVEAWLVARAASLSVRVDAAVKCEGIRRARNLVDCETGKLARDAAEELGDALLERKRKDPSEIVVRLEATAAGCEWMIERWKDMEARRREVNGSWEREELDLAMKLIGRTLRDLGGVNEVEELVSAYCCARSKMTRDKSMMHRLKFAKLVTNAELNLPADADLFNLKLRTQEDGQDQLSEFTARQIQRLTALRDELAEQEAENPAGGDLIDLSDDGDRLRRYETTLDRQLHNALRRIELMRKGRQFVTEVAESSTPQLPLGGVEEVTNQAEFQPGSTPAGQADALDVADASVNRGVEDSATATRGIDSATAIRSYPWRNPDGSTDWDKFNDAIRKRRGMPQVVAEPVETSLRNGANLNGNHYDERTWNRFRTALFPLECGGLTPLPGPREGALNRRSLMARGTFRSTPPNKSASSRRTPKGGREASRRLPPRSCPQ